MRHLAALLPTALCAAFPLQANHWYLAWAGVDGPSSDCGSGDQNTVATEDQLTFTFKPSKESSNGTDVNAGQIPHILFRVVTKKSMPSEAHCREYTHYLRHS